LVVEVLTTRRVLRDELAREPTLEEVMGRMEMPLKRLLTPLAVIQGLRELNLPLGEIGTSETLLMAIRVLSGLALRKGLSSDWGFYVEGSSKDPGQGFSIRRETLEREIASLTPREGHLLPMSFGIGIRMDTDHTLEEVGQQFSVTREQIRRIEAKALGKLNRIRKLKQRRSESHAYGFRPIGAADLPLIRDWLRRPHVARWWSDPGQADRRPPPKLGRSRLRRLCHAA
jgi:DNA-directed RNA polymerase specialized sigma subunit